MKYFDIHSHLYFKDFDVDRDETIARMRDANVGTITVGTNADTSKTAIVTAKNLDNWATVGFHPADVGEDVASLSDDLQSIDTLAKEEEVVAVGECGFDFFHNPDNVEVQEKVFVRQIEVAVKHNLPIMLHLRSSKDGRLNAYRRALDILKSFPGVKINSHFFAGTKQEAKEIVDCGGTVSFTGVITFARDYEELVKYVPLENMHAETDAPFVAPVPHRGNRNEPTYVIEVVEKIVELKKLNQEKVREQLIKNAKQFFSIVCD
jgi:TatD DNase family protein